jgi:hypothetical protein
MNPFDYVNDILQGKKNLIVDEITEKDYQPFLVNRSLSYHMDCIIYANEMNRRHHLDKKMQNDFLINTIRSRKRPFAKWIKPVKDENLNCLMVYYGFSEVKAREALNLLSEEQLEVIKQKTDIGGLRNKNG